MSFLNNLFKKNKVENKDEVNVSENTNCFDGIMIDSFEKNDLTSFSYLHFKLSNGRKVNIMIPSMRYAPADAPISVPSNAFMAFGDGEGEPLTESESKEFLLMIAEFANKSGINIVVRYN